MSRSLACGRHPSFFVFLILLQCFISHDSVCRGQEAGNDPRNLKLIESAVSQLLDMQDSDGAWPYEGVYRVRGKIPVGYRIGGTAIVCSALLEAPIKDRTAADAAIRKGIKLIVEELKDPLMKPSQKNTYDVRVWGHIYALDLFVRLVESKRFEGLNEELKEQTGRLVSAVVHEELKQGGWNYAGRNQHAPFVTGPALQSLLIAKSQGHEVSKEVFDRGAQALNESRKDGAYAYSGPASSGEMDKLPGSIARNVVCETTLSLLGQGDQKRLKASIDAFYEHWDELENRRKKTGTHLPPNGVAPYYFYYGHRYLAQGISQLPPEKQAAEYARFETQLLKTKDENDTWNDRVFDRSAAFGTAMSVLALSRQPIAVKPDADTSEQKK